MRVRTVIGATVTVVAAAVVLLTTLPAAADGEVVIEVMANGEPADSAPGPTVESGATVNLRYVITVVSSEPLFDFVVISVTGDSKPDCDVDDDGTPDGTNNHPGGKSLESGDSFVCFGSTVAGDAGATYASAGRVTAYNEQITATFTHEDAAHFTVVQPTTTTQAPTTAVPSTAPPTTAVPTTAAPTTVAPTTQAPSTVTTVAATSPSTIAATSTTTNLASAPASVASPPSSSWSSTSDRTDGPADEDAHSPEELAATDDDSEGVPLWWVVFAFAIGGAVAAGGSGYLLDKEAAAPDQ